MTMMTATLERKLQLQADIDRVEEEIRALDTQSCQRFHYGNDWADEANDLFERTRNLSLRCHLEGKLWQLRHALKRINMGQDSVCERCDEPIDPARIEVAPEATLCIHCQRRIEQRG